MMTQRLVADITNRRKLQHEIDRALGELRRQPSCVAAVICGHDHKGGALAARVLRRPRPHPSTSRKETSRRADACSVFGAAPATISRLCPVVVEIVNGLFTFL